MSALLSVQAALEQILLAFEPVSSEQVSLGHALNRVLAQPVSAGFDLPPFSNSSMDGFAVRAADTAGSTSEQPTDLRIIADIPAGSPFSGRIEKGQAARIMTGAPVPDGADAVVPVEATSYPYRAEQAVLPPIVSIYQSVSPGANIRPRGQDIHQGEALYQPGYVLRAQDIGMLATLGIHTAGVFQLPRVALFSSGDELVSPGEPLLPGKIYDSNTYILTALTEQAGCEVISLGLAPDQPDKVTELLCKAVELDADLILTSAGVSVGAFDYVRKVIEQEGQLDLWRVNMRPGKPLAFGRFKGVPFIGLPGNPVSTFVGFQVFVLPVLQRLAGRVAAKRQVVKVTTMEPIESDGRESYLRAVVTPSEGGFTARLTGHQGSGNLFSLVQANALLIVPSGVKSLPSGAELDAWLL